MRGRKRYFARWAGRTRDHFDQAFQPTPTPTWRSLAAISFIYTSYNNSLIDYRSPGSNSCRCARRANPKQAPDGSVNAHDSRIGSIATPVRLARKLFDRDDSPGYRTTRGSGGPHPAGHPDPDYVPAR